VKQDSVGCDACARSISPIFKEANQYKDMALNLLRQAIEGDMPKSHFEQQQQQIHQ
jgi:hypothetical protein